MAPWDTCTACSSGKCLGRWLLPERRPQFVLEKRLLVLPSLLALALRFASSAPFLFSTLSSAHIVLLAHPIPDISLCGSHCSASRRQTEFDSLFSASYRRRIRVGKRRIDNRQRRHVYFLLECAIPDRRQYGSTSSNT